MNIGIAPSRALLFGLQVLRRALDRPASGVFEVLAVAAHGRDFYVLVREVVFEPEPALEQPRK